jgi:UDP-glucose:(heptosyl)LPS alpha-1,3-glucosyltransferase
MKLALTFSGCHRRGGVERVVFEAARFLGGRGHDVHVFANEWDDVGSDNVHYHAVPMVHRPAFMGPATFFTNCTHRVNVEEFDAISTHGCVSPLGGVQWVHSVHRAWLEYSRKFRGRFSMGRIKQLLNPMHPALLRLESRHFKGRNYQRIIAMTDDVKRDLNRFYAVPAEDVTVIPNGFAPDEFNVARCRSSRAAMRKKLGYGNDDRVIVFVANEYERKGFGPLLRAIAKLSDPNLNLLAVGRLDPATYAAEIASLGMTDRVKIEGPTKDVWQYYAAADAFALPTQYEAWGLVIVEAMACGLPVLTSRLAGAAVAVDEGVNGELLDDPKNVDEIGSKLRVMVGRSGSDGQAIADSVQQYAWPQLFQRYEQVLIDQTNVGRATASAAAT